MIIYTPHERLYTMQNIYLYIYTLAKRYYDAFYVHKYKLYDKFLYM